MDPFQYQTRWGRSQMPNAGESQPPREGQIVTFYSFKGGTGRTMALANVAWILAANGKRVLIADWDLESPGLHRFFQPFIDVAVSERPGIIDIIRRYAWAMVESPIDLGELHGREKARETARPAIDGIIDEHIDRVNDHAIRVDWEFPEQGALHFLSPGKLTNGDYQATLGSLDWDNFYDNLAGGKFFDALREKMKRTYDYVLIDSRTGLGDVADICTVHLPDIVIDCFTMATQGIEGAAMIAELIQEHTKRRITILPVPMRIDHAQEEKVQAGLLFAARKFEKLLAGMSEDERRAYLAEAQVPYQASYAYEETLAAFAEGPGSSTGLLSYYEQMVARITGGTVSTLPPREEWLRLQTRLLFSRTASSPAEIVLDFSPEDQLWAEWVAAVLASAEVTVRWVGGASAGPADPDAERQTVAIISESYVSRMRDSDSAVHPDLLIFVTDTRQPPEFAGVPAIFLAPLTEAQAVKKLVDEFKGRLSAEAEAGIGALRYPGADRPQISNIPTRNINFTGRDQDLRDLREQLRARREALVLPLAIQGLGGVGKTQLALEYVHRFKADYDIIWWMTCGLPQYVDASLADLGQRMREKFGADVPEEGGIGEVVRKVLHLLEEELTDQRWLLVYDNAEAIEELKALMPEKHGQLLITSRNRGWLAPDGKSLRLAVFKREESVLHLLRRKPTITEEEADQVAEALSDIPLAVAAAGALLASTDMSVAEYLRKLDEQPTLVLPEGHPLLDYPPTVAKATSLSLDQLQKNSPAAARLLEICSVMAPDISQELINTQAMADALRDLDATISERAMIAKLIRNIDVLALIKVDNNVQQIQVHRVVQAVVNERMSDEEKAARRSAVHQVLVEVRPGDVDDPQTWPRYRLIWPHLRPSEAMWSAEARVRQLLIERVRYIRQREDLERGQRRAEETERAWTIMLSGQPDPEVPASLLMVKGKPEKEAAESLQRQLLRMQFNRANILRDLSQFQESRALDEAVLDGQTVLLGPEHLHTLQTRSSLAGDLRALGEYQAALEQDQQTYEAWRNGYGEEYRSTLSAAHNLALSYLLNGDFRRALTQDRINLGRRSSVHGPTHPRTFNSGASVARDLLEAGRYADAVSQIQTVWDQSRKTLGDEDRNTLTARALLGVALRCAGHPGTAEHHIIAARSGLAAGFGENSSDTLACRMSLALNNLVIGRLEEARTGAEQVLQVYDRRLGRVHPHTLICGLNIATALCLEEDYQAAETQARSAAEGLRGRLSPSHPYTLAAQMVLASIHALRNDLPAARELEEMVVAERAEVLGPNHPDTLRCQANLLLTQHAQEVEGASARRQAVLGDLAALIGAEHPDVTTALKGDRLLCAIDPLPF
jgi:MinD-like ATPase involved in chromosome partitioning or flagellar assembly